MGVGRRVEIISKSYRIAHTHNLHFIAILSVTGLTVMALEYFSWLAYVVGLPFAPLLGVDPVTAGVQIFRVLHRIFGVAWGGLLVVYGCYLFCSGKARVFDPLKKPLRDQLKEASSLAKHYLLGKPIPEEVLEKMERHNVFVSYLAILLGVGFALLAVSGVGLMLRYALGLTAQQAAILLFLHDLGFGITVLFVLFHLFAAFHPSNRPLLDAMFGNGTAPFDWVAEHMKAYVKRYGVAPEQ
ncbi:cytochrome b/b6 domain-containing protein [Thermofilum pendens]|uniref:Formate dehydrogenase, cytochrome b556 subunit (Formate dehydrogenase gamma subunit) n=1 Tax=Thermofilum pendens (strain DSM 2475 / Hrk 5) TaxID=368408 RepID=A1S027_THEPD|nr:formate dehydrogenase, cytochrome b556 subunit (formate dehydrogenase gamma subunit) [Thermofilum pendens Hrk 5]